MATDNKYDRQLRLWGSEGQQRLSVSRVCVLGSSGLSSEILKNLVLPGLGYFLIVDDAIVQEKDLGENFFVTAQELGQPRAEVVKHWLLELNPDVQGESLFKPISEILSTPDFFSSFNLIIASQLHFKEIQKISDICKTHSIDLVISKSNGLLGYLRVYSKEHLVIEGKPSDKEIFDLRLNQPFDELKAYCESVELDGIEEIYHSHVPFIVILLKLLKQFEEAHGHKPSNFEEKEKFKAFIKSKSTNLYNEQNFQEAVDKAYLCFIKDEVPESAQGFLSDPKCVEADENSHLFWRCARSIKEFVDQTGFPPLSGLFPDMTSDTNSYITMQNLYKAKADSDYSKVLANFQRISKTDAEPLSLRLLCKNLSTSEVTRFRSISEELTELNTEFIESLDPEEEEFLDWYLALRALDEYTSVHSKPPEKTNIEELNSICERIKKPVKHEILEEIVRFGFSELHCISALIGGVGSQEAVKLITKQFTPINNTFIYSGVHSNAFVLTL